MLSFCGVLSERDLELLNVEGCHVDDASASLGSK